MKRSVVKKAWPFLGLYLSIVFPSLGEVQKYVGTLGVFLYLVLAFLGLLVICRYCARKILSRITEKQAFFMAILTVVSLAMIFFAAYPMVNARIATRGSDRDDDINIAAGELLHLRYPYHQKTYLGNPITHFPGSILLSIPFVLLGSGAFQNFFWLFVFFIVARFFMQDWRPALLALWIILLFSPVVMQELLAGGDLLSNSVYILFFIIFMVSSVSAFGAKKWKKILSAILLGVGLSSRLNFILLLPLVFSVLVRNTGWQSAVKYTGLTVLAFLAVTLPFYLYSPADFSPLYGQFNKINMFHNVLPFPGILVPLWGAIIAFALSLRRMPYSGITLFINCMLVQFFLVLSLVILHSMATAKLDLILSGYGITFLFFGVLSFWYLLSRDIPA